MDLHALQHALVSRKAEIQKQLGLEELANNVSKVAAGVKRKRPEDVTGNPTDMGGWRRSSRTAALGRINYKEENLEASMQSIKQQSTVVAASSAARVDDDEAEREVVPQQNVRIPSTPPSGSLKTLATRMDYMKKMYLGRHVPIRLGGEGNQAKRAVMNEACANPGVRPTFSKMTGIQEWSNAIFLFMNVGEGSTNEFLEGGRKVTWYAQNRQSILSAQIQRLIHHKTGITYPPVSLAEPADDGESGSASTFLEPCHVALICRVDDDPYIWCGELDYISHDSTTHPLKFVWALKDSDALLADVDNEFNKISALELTK